MSQTTSGHIAHKGRVCPRCKRKDTIVFWKNNGVQATLTGTTHEVDRRTRPKCTACSSTFGRAQKFEVVR